METVTEAPAPAPPTVENYQYRDAQLNVIWVTSVPKDDEAAIAYFHSILLFGKEFLPVYVEKKVVVDGKERYKALPWRFNLDTYTTERWPK
jgi:predicted SpoU family rRNA methylase